jgi:hypothetical protein
MITAISTDWGTYPRIVRVTTTDNLGAITATGYITSQLANIALIQNGVFEWTPEDEVLIYYSGGQGFFTYDSTTAAFIAQPASAGTLTDTLASGDIFVGNASNIATGVAMSGDATISNTGALTIGAGAITGSKIANNGVDYAQLALDVAATATVNLTAAQVNGMYATPVQLLAAPGAGKLIIIDQILWDIAFVSAQYAAGGAIAAQYGNTVHGAGPAASGSLAAASLNGVAASGYLSNGGISGSLNVTSAASLNTAVFLSNATGAFTTGNSTVTMYVKYRVVTPA